jgi:uncharacterized protein YggE
MKRLVVVAVLLMLCMGTLAWAADAPAVDNATAPVCVPRLDVIRVTGQAVVKVMPDLARLQFTLRASDAKLPAAREKAAADMNKLLDAIKALHLPGLTLNTTAVNVEPQYAPLREGQSPWTPNGEVARTLLGYAVTNTVTATIHAEGDALRTATSQLLDLALTSPTVDLGGPWFSKEDLTAARVEGLEKATRDAIANAQAIARGMEVKITGYNYASMYAAQAPQPMEMNMKAMAMAPGGGGTPTPVEIEAQTVDVTVYLDAVY